MSSESKQEKERVTVSEKTFATLKIKGNEKPKKQKNSHQGKSSLKSIHSQFHAVSR